MGGQDERWPGWLGVVEVVAEVAELGGIAALFAFSVSLSLVVGIQKILGNVADPIVVTDATGQIILMSQQAERLFHLKEGLAQERSEAILLANDAKLSSLLSQLGGVF